MRRAKVVCIAIALVLGLPLLGVLFSGQPLSRYLEFPPRTIYVEHDPFSWPVFLVLTLVLIISVGTILFRVLISNYHPSAIDAQRLDPTIQNSALLTQNCFSSFPWWGWMAIGWTCLWWVLAWTRLPWMAALQEHTFTPLWLGYIVVVNAWTFARTGHCMLLHRPRYMLSLFPLSALFWWIFEYLNRFVQNWYYVGAAELSPLEYFLRATIPFSTVLPAVMSTAEMLTAYSDTSTRQHQFKPVRLDHAKSMIWAMFILSCLALLGLGLWPNYLFPFVWVGPLMLVVSLQVLSGQQEILSPLVRHDLRLIWVPALAALICGVFWELWNWKSLAHWQYAIPFVHDFQVFEMPILGYAGYLPFGLECVVVADLCLNRRFAGGVEYYRSRSTKRE